MVIFEYFAFGAKYIFFGMFPPVNGETGEHLFRIICMIQYSL